MYEQTQTIYHVYLSYGKTVECRHEVNPSFTNKQFMGIFEKGVAKHYLGVDNYLPDLRGDNRRER